jgi:hypothetical protein
MDPEFRLRELMLEDAKVYRIRNQIAEKTDPQSNKNKAYRSKAKAKKTVKVEPDEHSTEDTPQ